MIDPSDPPPPELTEADVHDMERGLEREKWQAMWLHRLKYPACIIMAGSLYGMFIPFPGLAAPWGFDVVLFTIIVEFVLLFPFLWTWPESKRGLKAMEKLGRRMDWNHREEARRRSGNND